ncbi:hypothetical protein GG681_07480 [Epibacterium sp. SM1969]|uniref:Uncharacterized protein n=1 Tax=Tritonibacter aquimaris TaxID=2663379 RepID=A0A844AKW1_9RHOB|nr:hypothetical protein [Tritonibacter aquimaris]MQY42480.1 hypothetical protein [Tritonibacter aquimaris]
MPYNKIYNGTPARHPDGDCISQEVSDLKPLVDHAIERARNWDFEAAKAALKQAQRQLND